MATKSFFKTVVITGDEKIERFVNALDAAEEWRIAHQNDPKPNYHMATEEEIGEIFAGYGRKKDIQ